MGVIAKTVGTTLVAGGIFVAGIWTGGANLDRTKDVVDEMVSIIVDTDTENKELKIEKQRLENLVADLTEQIEGNNNGNGNIAKGLKKQLEEAKAELEAVKTELANSQSEVEKANEEIDKANAEAEALRIYAEQELEKVKELTGK
jgi:chromosome segregation ATPase